jgi:D-alanyl-lipoteichoic acid acyltransferase DltB (MBOAT superfamily)
MFSTVVDFFIGQKIHMSKDLKLRKMYLILSLATNLGILGFFKYFNFFIDSFIDLVALTGYSLENQWTLNIILPVGISFYTFQTLSYTIDIYRKQLTPTNNFISFAAFVAFFPQLVAGPIERAKNLLPQFKINRSFSYKSSVDGLRQILWGFFKKIVIADNCAIVANAIFSNPESFNGIELLIGALFFTFQIYGDFSGYSDIAIGVGRLFGFTLMKNFAYPYFSRDIAEFWRRWHISLSSWFRDYVYIPLGGSRGSEFLKVRNTFIIFLVSGFWHGANWTFLMWGLLNALYFIPLLISNKNRENIDIVAKDKMFPSFKELVQIISTFTLTVIAWIFFRSESLSQAFLIISKIFSPTLFICPSITNQMIINTILLLIFISIEWIGRDGEYALERLLLKNKIYFRWMMYFILMFLILIFSDNQQEFIYFQF